MEYIITRLSDDELMHYGVPGMKWGVRKQKYYESKYGRKLTRSKKADNRVMLLREKRLKKYDKKIEKMKAKRKDFVEGTKLVKRGQDTYNDIIKKRMDTKIKAINDPSYKKTFEYKNAGANYVMQTLSDSFSSGGSAYTKLNYAHEIANKRDPRI